MRHWAPELTSKDIRFISETLALPENYLRDNEYLEEILSDEMLFKRIMSDEEILLKISPFLFFKVLLKRAQRELKWESYTVEKHGLHSVYVFDTDILSDVLHKRDVINYLASLLASFTKVKSFSIYLIIRKKLYKFKQSSLDIDALEEELNYLEEDKRFPLLKRIADTTLFLSGMFPEYLKKRAEELTKKKKKSPNELLKEFEEKGSLYYHLASMHEDAKKLGLSDVLYTFAQNFSLLKKPINLIERKYLFFRKDRIF
ncbi:MAG: hypothetical protein N2513_02160 [Deltaproteobacteria bacterium]|nr:hypothetical protein [Deltaproteobacteria bacterium]